MAVDGGGSSRVFEIANVANSAASGLVALSGLTIQDGAAPKYGSGGGVKVDQYAAASLPTAPFRTTAPTPDTAAG